MGRWKESKLLLTGHSCDLIILRDSNDTSTYFTLFMETHAFASLAHVRILLIPVGLIPKPLYESYAAEIRSFTTLKLAEIPAETKDGRG